LRRVHTKELWFGGVAVFWDGLHGAEEGGVTYFRDADVRDEVLGNLVLYGVKDKLGDGSGSQERGEAVVLQAGLHPSHVMWRRWVL
jgi:hypothetical protein